MEIGRPQPLVSPPFEPKNPEIQRLEDYSGIFEDEYWNKWPFNPLNLTPDPWIDPHALFMVALESNYTNLVEVCLMCSWLSEGAPLGAQGAARMPAQGENLQGMSLHGFEGLDAICCWVKQRLLMGPFKHDEIPVNELRVSPLNIEIKPNSSEFLFFLCRSNASLILIILDTRSLFSHTLDT